MSEFCGKTAVVTGAAGGVGRATAISFAQAGASVLIADINGEKLNETHELIGERCVRSLVGDCADEDFIHIRLQVQFVFSKG